MNLPQEIREPLFRYGMNGFALYGISEPRKGCINGIIAENGMGKSTILKLLAGKLNINFGKNVQVEKSEILKYFRGSSLQDIFKSTKLVSIKPQHIDKIAKINKKVIEVLSKYENYEAYIKIFGMEHLLQKNLEYCSGGELQGICIITRLLTKADIYCFDEPTSYLDIKQRLKISTVLKEFSENKEIYTIIVEHDLVILDYLSDYINFLYGSPGCYSVVSQPFTEKEGINCYLRGYDSKSNTRFREFELSFQKGLEEERKIQPYLTYESKIITKGSENKFVLNMESGTINTGEIVLLLGENGTGKTTFLLSLLSSLPDPKISISYKPQKIYEVHDKISHKLVEQFLNGVEREIIETLEIDRLMNKEISMLSGGELQRICISHALGKKTDLYFLDEMSSFLDVRQKINCCKLIKKLGITAFIVEHDIMMALYLADKVIVFEGEVGVNCKCSRPVEVKEGMNKFLSQLGITFRRDGETARPRMNKPNSQFDSIQKKSQLLHVNKFNNIFNFNLF